MDEELEQRGVTPESFFDQATETREMVQAVQKTSNSNLSLLNQLKERVRKIEIKLFDEEDKRQKEEMEAKVKEQNEKSQGSGGGSKEGGEQGGGTKGGGGGGVMGFISSFIGGLVGGTVGLAVQGAGAIIGLGTGLIKKGANLGKNLAKGFSNLFGGKKNEKGGEVKPKVNADGLMNLKFDDIKEKGKNILGGIGDAISNFDGRPGSRKTKKKLKLYNDYIKEGAEIMEIGGGDFHITYKDGSTTTLTSVGMGGEGDTLEERFNDHIKQKDKFREEQAERFKESDEKFDSKKKKKNIFGFNQGGEVDSVPAMLTPGEFVVTKDAVQKVGVDTLKGLNASVGATNKPTLMKGTTDSYLGSASIEFAGFNKGPVEKTMRMTDEGLEKTYFDDTTDIYELSSDDTYFHEKNEMIGSGLSSESIEKYKVKETSDDGTKSTFTEEVRTKDLGVTIGVPDLITHRNQLMSEINKLEGFEKVTFDQFMKKEHGIPQELLLPILYRSDASKATRKKKDRAEKLDREQGVQPSSSYRNPTILGYRTNQMNPAQYVSFEQNMSSKSGLKFSVAKGFNEGGLVTPIIESRDESGEMKLIQSLSQSVNTNRQTLMVMEEQNQAMNVPDQNPNPVALADAPQTAPSELQDTEAPIPFASLLRQSAQRYLNLGNNAMVIS